MPTIALDLDGTVAHWEGNGLTAGGWRDGGEKFVRALLAIPHDRWPTQVIVHSCRATWKAGGGWQSIAEFLAVGGFEPWLVETLSLDDDALREVWVPLKRGEESWVRVPELGGGFLGSLSVGIWHALGKPVASAYVDDRGVRAGDGVPWEVVLAEVQNLL